MEIYAFANQKGGVGKTTVTLGLAAALASRKLSSLLIDLDPQASATKVLGVDVEERHTVADVLLEPSGSACVMSSSEQAGASISRRRRPRSRHASRGARRLALQGIDELLETRELVRTHYNGELELGGVIVNRVERTVEHRDSVLEIERYFGADLVWQPLLPKRAVMQDATRRGVPVGELARRPARELAGAFATLAGRMEVSRVAA